MNKKSFNFKGEKLYLEIGNYVDNGRLYVHCHSDDENYSDITINLDMEIVNDNYAYIDSLATDCGLIDKLEELEIIPIRLGKYQYNMGQYECVYFDFKKLKEYDPEGFKEFEIHKELLHNEELSIKI